MQDSKLFSRLLFRFFSIISIKYVYFFQILSYFINFADTFFNFFTFIHVFTKKASRFRGTPYFDIQLEEFFDFSNHRFRNETKLFHRVITRRRGTKGIDAHHVLGVFMPAKRRQHLHR